MALRHHLRRVAGRGAGALAPALALAAACAAPADLPTYRVMRREFVHRVTAEGHLTASAAVGVTVPSEVRRTARIVWLADEGVEVGAGEVIARFDPSEMERRLEEGQADVKTSGLKLDKARVSGETRRSENSKNQEVASLELVVAERYQVRDEVLFSRVEIAESKIDKDLAKARLDHAAEVAPVQDELATTELELLEVERRKALIDVEQARQGLAALEVKAPAAGILTWVRDWQGDAPQVGDQVWRGQQLAEIPDLSVMQAEVFVLEADAGGLAPGKPARVVIDAHPDIVYAARIERVESVARPRFRGSPVQYFGVILAFDATDPAVMKPGQRVTATLLLEEIAAALVVPRGAVFQHAGAPHVRVLSGGKLELRAVKIGTQSIGLATLTSGLEVGEEIVLAAPESARPAVGERSEPQPLALPGGAV